MSRAVRDNSKAVSLFPFLAVLLCTMGALLVLLVVLAEQASRVAKEGATQSATDSTANVAAAAAPSKAKTSGELDSKIAELQLLRKLRDEQARQSRELSQRVANERAQLAHLEEHARRLEHIVAELYINNGQLKAAEGDLTVDSEQAKSELARLQQLIEETSDQVEEMQGEAKRPKTYAILPYRGPNGTFRPPVFIECLEEAIVVQPGGIELTEKDFVKPLRPGNALAAALRATQAHYNKEAAATGQEPLDPYPLLIVRPSGRNAYRQALAALKVADISFGYEFIAEGKQLEFPAVEPRLANTQSHAVEFARIQQERLAKAAPRRFARVAVGRGGGTGGGYGSGPGSGGQHYRGQNYANIDYGGTGNGGASDRYGESASADGLSTSVASESDNRFGSGQGSGSNAGSSGPNFPGSGSASSGSGGTGGGGVAGDGAGNPGESGTSGDPNAQGQNQAGDSSEAGESGRGGSGDGTGGSPGGSQASGSTADQGAAGGSSSKGSAGGSAGSEQASGGAGGGQPSPGQSGQQAGSTQTFSNTPQAESAAGERGADWALKKSRQTSMAMRRPIAVVVSREGFELLSGDGRRSSGPSGFVSFDQPTGRVLDEFAVQLQRRTKEWGLAGRSMHWKPVLMLNVDPDAQRQADNLARLLSGSGVDIRSSTVARTSSEGTPRVTR
ncbi:hypothetical protein [Adhaeretor mobilis]|uniref:Uncharacterized protein n=1 Tax=Adhaeretor mobilis TaxID=1930276 RepID=A0A517MYB1_9BACT|nr:hypothetical protein [Adhaeretor mobilis]QDS99864.1 hypothetical protein HG15A2_31950 [Adhaeretor mobilis]